MTRSCAWPVSMTVRFHLFPFRTQKLSSLVPKIVGWRRPVKIGRCRLLYKAASGPSLGPGPEFALYAPLAQLVEQLTLNQWVLGSSPRWCTRKSLTENVGLFFCCHNPECCAGAPSEDENSCKGDRRLRRKQGAGAGAAVAEAAARPKGRWPMRAPQPVRVRRLLRRAKRVQWTLFRVRESPRGVQR